MSSNDLLYYYDCCAKSTIHTPAPIYDAMPPVILGASAGDAVALTLLGVVPVHLAGNG